MIASVALRRLPVVYAQIGDLSLGILPVEMSTTQAIRIRNDFQTNESAPFQIVGLADEYSSYVATASEYAAQDYMGASTQWGPEEGAFFACKLKELREKDFGNVYLDRVGVFLWLGRNG